MVGNKAMPAGRQGFVHILLLILLLIGLGVGVYLVGQKTNLIPKASVSQPTGPEVSFTLSSSTLGEFNCGIKFLPCPLRPSRDSVQVGEEVSVELTARSDIDEANLFAPKLRFDPSLLEVTSIASSSGFIRNWVDQSYDNSAGIVSLVGGVPSPGYKTTVGQAGGDMTKVIFRTKAAGHVSISFDNASAIYRNTDNQDILAIKRNFDFDITNGSSPTPTPSIQSVEVHYKACASLGGNTSNQIRSNLADSTGNVLRGAITSLSNQCPNYQEHTDTFTTNPAGGVWSATDINGLQIGVESQGGGGDDRRVTQVRAVVNYGSSQGFYMPSNISDLSNKNDWILGAGADKLVAVSDDDGDTSYIKRGAIWGGDPNPHLQWYKISAGLGTPIKQQTLPDPACGPCSSPPPSGCRNEACGAGERGEVPGCKLVCSLPATKGDGNKDGKINLVDMSVLLSDFNKDKNFREPIDINDDKKINSFDFSLMRKQLIELKVIK